MSIRFEPTLRDIVYAFKHQEVTGKMPWRVATMLAHYFRDGDVPPRVFSSVFPVSSEKIEALIIKRDTCDV